MEQLSGSIMIMFSVVVLSYLTKIWRLMPENTNSVLTSLLYNVTAPCLIFSSLARGPGIDVLRDSIAVIVVAFAYEATASCLALWFLKKKDPSDRTAGVMAFTAVYANTAFMGIPLVYLLFGASGVVMGALYDQVQNLFVYTVGIMMLSRKGGNAVFTAGSRFKEPPVIALGAGLLVLLSGLKIPGPVLEPVAMIGDTTTVLAMFAIGQFMDLDCFRHGSQLKKLFPVVAIRLVLAPLIFLSLASLFPLPGEVKGVLGIMLAGPSPVMGAVLAQKFGQDYEFAVVAVVTTTALSIITLPLILSMI